MQCKYYAISNILSQVAIFSVSVGVWIKSLWFFESTTLDLFCIESKIKKIDILKIDVQGYELEVLRGAKNLLKNGLIKLIFIEWQVVPLYKDHFKFFEIAKYLSNYGYDFFNIYNINEARSGQIRWADAIYISNGIKENMIVNYGNGAGSGW